MTAPTAAMIDRRERLASIRDRMREVRQQMRDHECSLADLIRQLEVLHLDRLILMSPD
jgi:hypothetical protein